MFGVVVYDTVNRVCNDVVRMLGKTSGRSKSKLGKLHKSYALPNIIKVV
jgi:hypothetical protein